MMERDKFMSADEAKELGLIDEVLTSPPKMVDSKPPSPEWQGGRNSVTTYPSTSSLTKSSGQ